MFAAGELGAWYDPSDITTLFQDTAGAVPVTASGQAVARMNDKSGRGNNALQGTASKRPIYTVASGRAYLLFDGIDDHFFASAIDLTTVNKMTVISGVKRLSNAAGGIIAELGTNGAQAGIFTMADPITSSLGWLYRSRGTLAATAQQATIDAAPQTSVLTGVSDIAAPMCQIRRNGTLMISDPQSQGTGNYGNNIMVIGSRNGASLFFNGHLYGLIVRAAASTANELTTAEEWMNAKTGAY